MRSSGLAALALSLLAAAFVGASTGCSSASSSAGDATVPTHLDGLYEATSAGEVQWIAFSEPNRYSLLKGGDDCTVVDDEVDPTCVSVGSYTIDEATATLHLVDGQSNAVTSYPFATFSEAKNTAAPTLTTQDESLVSSGGGSGSLVNQGSALTSTPAAISLTQSNGSSQSLVSNAADCGTCDSGSTDGTSSGQSVSVQMSGRDPLRPDDVMSAGKKAVQIGLLVCSLQAAADRQSLPGMVNTGIGMAQSMIAACTGKK